jgi:hypothetical protein
MCPLIVLKGGGGEQVVVKNEVGEIIMIEQ